MRSLLRCLTTCFVVALCGCQSPSAFMSKDTKSCCQPSGQPTITNATIIAFAKQDVQLMPKGESLVVVLPMDQFFRTETPQLKTEKYAALDHLADLLKQYGNATVKIVGYTDTIQNLAQSKAFSVARARSVLVYLWNQGLDPDHLYAIGAGSADLAADPNFTDTNAANRRIEITVHAKCTLCF